MFVFQHEQLRLGDELIIMKGNPPEELQCSEHRLRGE